jgi:hypothetical protein
LRCMLMIGSPRVSHAVTSRRRHPQATPSNPKCLLSRSIPAGESRSRHNPAEESRRDSPIQPKVGFRFSVTDGIICASKSVEDSLLEPPSPVRPLGVALERDSSSRHWAEWAVPRTGKAGCSNPYGRAVWPLVLEPAMVANRYSCRQAPRRPTVRWPLFHWLSVTCRDERPRHLHSPAISA